LRVEGLGFNLGCGVQGSERTEDTRETAGLGTRPLVPLPPGDVRRSPPLASCWKGGYWLRCEVGVGLKGWGDRESVCLRAGERERERERVGCGVRGGGVRPLVPLPPGDVRISPPVASWVGVKWGVRAEKLELGMGLGFREWS